MTDTIFIYRIVRSSDGATVYIGKTADVEQRWKEHRGAVAYGSAPVAALMRRDGAEAFRIETIDRCCRREGSTVERAYMLSAMVRGHPIVNANPMTAAPQRRMIRRFEWFPWPHADFLVAQVLSNLSHIRGTAERYRARNCKPTG